jgi:hypothetical protein
LLAIRFRVFQLFEIVGAGDLKNKNPALAIGFVSHDVQMNTAFPEFVAKTYAHDKKNGTARRAAHIALRMGLWVALASPSKKIRAR